MRPPSIKRSLEKKPEVKGNPHKHKRQIITIKEKTGVIKENPWEFRKSCLLSEEWITNPAHINKEALNKAWVSKWKKVKITKEQEKEATIKPNCLKVEYAIIFFKSQSKIPIKPAKLIVKIPITINQNHLTEIIEENRINRYTPAVTKVEEWTKEETGVGAAIAAGSQEEKGTWALLVIKANTIKSAKKL